MPRGGVRGVDEGLTHLLTGSTAVQTAGMSSCRGAMVRYPQATSCAHEVTVLCHAVLRWELALGKCRVTCR